MTMERKLIIADKIILGIDKHGSPEILEFLLTILKLKQ